MNICTFQVCESVINKLREKLPDDAKPEEIEHEFKRFCKTAKGKDEKFVSIFNKQTNKLINK